MDTSKPSLVVRRPLLADLARRIARGDARVRLVLAGVLVLTAVLYTWGLDRNGYANSYYSAAVLAGTQSWKAFFFGAFDSGSFITVDKPPAALWLMALSGRLFGFGTWSVLLPEALLGVGTVALVYATVRRLSGPVAGLLAAVAMALTPVAVLMFRFNNPDALLTFLLTASAWALALALQTGRTRWLLASAAIVGLAFLTKYLQAYIVLPALVLTYFLFGTGTWGRRTVQLLAAAGVLLVTSGWWVAAVELVPANARPFVGGSTDNSVLNLIFNYDGFGRLVGAVGRGAGRVFGGGGPGGGGFGGQPGPLRLFNSQLGVQVSWLLPLAAAAAALGLWARRGRPRTDLARAGTVLWGLWLVTHAVVFSFASGILHSYYTVAMAPAVAALVGTGAVDLWRLRSRSLAAGLVGAAALLLTAWWGDRLLAGTPGFAPGLGTAELALAAVAAVLLVLPRSSRLPRGLPAAAVAAGMVAVLLGPAAFSLATAARATAGADPVAGPAAVTPDFAAGGGRFAGIASPFGNGQPGGPGMSVSSALVRYLEQHQGGATWLVATRSANEAAPIELATGRAVLAMGGFSGGDPAVTVAQLQELVRSGRLRYVLAGGGPGSGGGAVFAGGPPPGGLRGDQPPGGFATPAGAGVGGSQTVMAWVTQNCTSVTISGTRGSLYDCAGAAGGPAS